jgi:predicted metal-dependent hydrolase
LADQKVATIRSRALAKLHKQLLQKHEKKRNVRKIIYKIKKVKKRQLSPTE